MEVVDDCAANVAGNRGGAGVDVGGGRGCDAVEETHVTGLTSGCGGAGVARVAAAHRVPQRGARKLCGTRVTREWRKERQWQLARF